MSSFPGPLHRGSSLAVVAALAAVIVGAALLRHGSAAPEASVDSSASPTASSESAIDHYTCSMHPSVHKDKPGTCPVCGMNLIPVGKESHDQGVVTIDARRQQLIGVRTEPVVTAPMLDTLRAVGRVTYDESALTDVNLKVHGWITKLFANRTGQYVRKGDPLFSMYSPELYNAEQDFVLALQGTAAAAAVGGATVGGPGALARASRQRLHLLGLADGPIDAIAQGGAPSEDVPVPSPASGYVIEKNVVDGASVDAGMRLYRIAALNKVWIDTDVYEADVARVRIGQRATVTLDYVPGRAYEAKVSSIVPFLDPASRTGRVRIELGNADLDLRPGMYANVALVSDLGVCVQVPASAVVYTGPRRLVFVDLGEGRFRPTEVQVGIESNGMFEVLSGLSPGSQVATSGVFLIAAEARIRTAATYWDSVSEMADAGALAPLGRP
jgi:Cu(I)/Ag(I) efflux system membrane fusion protein